MNRLFVVVVAALLAAAVQMTSAQQNAAQAEKLLASAQRKATIDGDLKGAIEEYKKVVAASGSNRALAAQALVRMAECFQKLGDAEAKKTYERVVRDFADQTELVALARTRLGEAETKTQATLATRRMLERGQPHDRISPDGRFLARIDGATENLVLQELATGKIRPLTTDGISTEPDHRFPLASTFSRDGRQIAYQWYIEKDDRSVLRVVSTTENAAGTPRTVYDNHDVEMAPTDWSPDGKWIAGVIRRKDNIAQIGIVNVADGSLRVLKTVDWSRVGGLRFSPDSSLLAYHRPEKDDAFERDVFVIAVDGSRETVAAQSPGDDIVLEWTPDGRRLLVASDRGGSMSVWSVPPSGQTGTSSYELVKSDVGIINSLGPTRDGTFFYSVLPVGSAIYVAKFDTASGQLSTPPVQPIQQFKGWNSGPSWSSDGAYLAFASRRDIPAPINVTRITVPFLSMATGKVERELHPALSYGGVGRWSPDGRLFIVRGADLKGRSGILTVDATTGDATLLAPNETCSGVPHWSNDGQSVFCYATPEFQSSKQPEIVQLDVVSGKVQRTYPAAGPTLGVSPDGRYIVYGDYDDQKQTVLRLLTLSTGETRAIIRLASPSSRIGNQRSVGWTPDNRSVVFYGTINGDEGMWLAPIDGAAPHKITLGAGLAPVVDWRFNAKTGQVAFSVGDANGGRLEIWKMENFLPAQTAKR